MNEGQEESMDSEIERAVEILNNNGVLRWGEQDKDFVEIAPDVNDDGEAFAWEISFAYEGSDKPQKHIDLKRPINALTKLVTYCEELKKVFGHDELIMPTTRIYWITSNWLFVKDFPDRLKADLKSARVLNPNTNEMGEYMYLDLSLLHPSDSKALLIEFTDGLKDFFSQKLKRMQEIQLRKSKRSDAF